MKGWKYESWRHSLAAKGIRSSLAIRNRKSMAWAKNFEPQTKEYTENVLDDPELVVEYPRNYNNAQLLVASENILENSDKYSEQIVELAKEVHQKAIVGLKLSDDYPKELERDIRYDKLIKNDASGQLKIVPDFQEYNLKRKRKL